MSTIKSFFDNTFFMNGTEGVILLVICVVAAVLTIVAIALAIAVAATVARRKRENASEVSFDQTKKSSANQAGQAELGQSSSEQTEQTEQEEYAQSPTQLPEGFSSKAPVATSDQAEAFFAESGAFYNKSFTAKLIQSSDEVKSWYARLKNELLSYKKVKARMSWKRESFRIGRNIVARLGYRGNTLCVYLPLDPADYKESKYKIEDVAAYASYADTPCVYRLKNEKRVRYATELIAAVMSTLGAVRVERIAENYYMPYEDTEALIEKDLIRRIQRKAEVIFPQDPAEEDAAADVLAEQPANEVELAEEDICKEDIAQAPAIENVPVAVEAVNIDENRNEECADVEIESGEAPDHSIDDVGPAEEQPNDEALIDVVGVIFRRRGKKVYFFDPDGKSWEEGEIALYITPTMPPQEVIVVENIKIAPSKLHIPLKPLYKAPGRPQTSKKQ